MVFIKKFKIFFVIGAVSVLILIYTYGALEHLRRVNMGGTDQSSYINTAIKMHDSGYKNLGRGNQMPIYPFLLTLIYDEHMSYEDFFIYGKYFNIVLSIILLICLFFIFKKYLSIFQASILLLIVAFTVFIFKAAFVQAELLLYFLGFFGFFLMCRNFFKPSWQLGLMIGALVAAGYLTKASVLPGFILYIMVGIFKMAYELYKKKRTGIRSQVLSMICSIFVFLLILFPYLHNNKKIYGKCFYNVNTTYYMWYDSWQACKINTGVYNDRRDMPPYMIPGPVNYFKNHNFMQIMIRMFYVGYKMMLSNMYSYGYYKYAVIYLLLLCVLLIFNYNYSVKIFKNNFFLTSFCMLYFLSYFILFSWYGMIVFGNRLSLTIFLPLMFSIFMAVKSLSKDYMVKKWCTSKSINIFNAVNMAVFVIIIYDIFDIVTRRILLIYGGA
ncbi:hypothetical protein ACFLUV_01025 [Elusimicrobiota bacterium]